MELTIATITMLMALLLLLPWRATIAALIAMTFMALLTGIYYKARLQGITGDCLGATNQLTEVSMYLTALVLLRFGFIQ
jgi:adenosylcobinamide-GDP ribazoletransferase